LPNTNFRDELVAGDFAPVLAMGTDFDSRAADGGVETLTR